jgi:PIN domain nuclease of toxin-antitoxin system
MKLLLDTQVLLWWLDDHPRLGVFAREHIADRNNQVYFSAASVWEAGIKEAKGQLRLADDFDAKLASEPFVPIAINLHHARHAGRLPLIHKDPFDRLLVAQCLVENMSLISADALLSDYGVLVIAA